MAERVDIQNAQYERKHPFVMVGVHAQTLARTHAHSHTHTHTVTHTHTQTHTDTHRQTQTYTHTHTHMRTHRQRTRDQSSKLNDACHGAHSEPRTFACYCVWLRHLNDAHSFTTERIRTTTEGTRTHGLIVFPFPKHTHNVR